MTRWSSEPDRGADEKAQPEQRVAVPTRWPEKTQRVEAVGEFSAGVAHDFKNYLTIVSACLEVARGNGGPAAQNAMDRAAEAVAGAAALAQRLLEVSRTESGPRGPLELAPLVAEVFGLLESSVSSRITLRKEVASDLCVIGNAPTLRQVLLNLVLNARDAMAETGTLTVRVQRAGVAPPSLALAERANGYVIVEVEDGGCGMDEATVTRIFDPFFSTKPERGTGLGATLVYGIVREHEGTVTVQSASQQGTTVRVYLPAATGVETPDEAARPLVPSAATA